MKEICTEARTDGYDDIRDNAAAIHGHLRSKRSVCVSVCVFVTSEEHALAEVTAHVIHADGLDSKQVQHIGGDGRNDSLLDNTHKHTTNKISKVI